MAHKLIVITAAEFSPRVIYMSTGLTYMISEKNLGPYMDVLAYIVNTKDCALGEDLHEFFAVKVLNPARSKPLGVKRIHSLAAVAGQNVVGLGGQNVVGLAGHHPIYSIEYVGVKIKQNNTEFFQTLDFQKAYWRCQLLQDEMRKPHCAAQSTFIRPDTNQHYPSQQYQLQSQKRHRYGTLPGIIIFLKWVGAQFEIEVDFELPDYLTENIQQLGTDAKIRPGSTNTVSAKGAPLMSMRFLCMEQSTLILCEFLFCFLMRFEMLSLICEVLTDVDRSEAGVKFVRLQSFMPVDYPFGSEPTYESRPTMHVVTSPPVLNAELRKHNNYQHAGQDYTKLSEENLLRLLPDKRQRCEPRLAPQSPLGRLYLSDSGLLENHSETLVKVDLKSKNKHSSKRQQEGYMMRAFAIIASSLESGVESTASAVIAEFLGVARPRPRPYRSLGFGVPLSKRSASCRIAALGINTVAKPGS
ncbi:hypothetical protein Q9966_013685 [Columba livia]|nr:hypothetical protein Q9966_013685 [Columba livia]